MNRTVIDTLSFFLFAGDETTELDEINPLQVTDESVSSRSYLISTRNTLAGLE